VSIMEGMPHDFMMFPQLDGQREGHRRVAEFFRNNL